LRLRCGDPLSNVAYNFNLRRYTEARQAELSIPGKVAALAKHEVEAANERLRQVGWCKPVETHVDSALLQRLRQNYDKPLPSFDFKTDLRPYTEVEASAAKARGEIESEVTVGPGRYCSPRHMMPFNSRHEYS
jgi:hypothetical protein